MIAFIKGTLENVFENYVFIDCNGIGYQVYVSHTTVCNLPKQGETIKIYTFLNAKDDGVSLFGFLNLEELNMFNLLITVSGVGPKGALAMLSSLTPSDIILGIITDDINTLSKAQGVGKKTAQRLVLELRDKVETKNAITSGKGTATSYTQAATSEKQDAIEALLTLGYSRSEAVKGVMEVAQEEMTVDVIIKLALKKMSKSK